MIKFSKVFLLYAFSCSFIGAASSATPERFAGEKRRTSDPHGFAIRDSVAQEVAAADCPASPLFSQVRKADSGVEVWSANRGLRRSPAKAIPASVRNALSEGVASSPGLKSARAALEEAKGFDTPGREKFADYAAGNLDAHLAASVVTAALAAGRRASQDEILAGVLQGNFNMVAAQGPRGCEDSRLRSFAAYRKDIERLNPMALTSGLPVDHVETPIVLPDGGVFGGHVMDAFAQNSTLFHVQESLIHPGGKTATIRVRTHSKGQKPKNDNLKTVLLSPGAKIHAMVHQAPVSAVSADGDKKLVLTPSGIPFITYSKETSNLRTAFPAFVVNVDSDTVDLGNHDSGRRVTLPSESLKNIVRECFLDPEKRKRLVPLYNKEGEVIAVTGDIPVPDVMSRGMVIHLPEDLKHLAAATSIKPDLSSPVIWKSPAAVRRGSGLFASPIAVAGASARDLSDAFEK